VKTAECERVSGKTGFILVCAGNALRKEGKQSRLKIEGSLNLNELNDFNHLAEQYRLYCLKFK
jgi:hypothetical protein